MSDGTASEASFESALRELDGLVARLESGELPLEDALTAFERGVALVKAATARLDAAELRVRELRIAADGVEEVDLTLGEDA